MPTLKIFELRQRFRKSVEYLWRYRVFGVTVYRLKVATFKCCRWAKFSTCHCKNNIPPHLNLSNQMHTLNIFELMQRFRKSVDYLWRYRIFAGTVYRLKVANFQMLSIRKFLPCHCKSKIPRHLKFFHPNAPPPLQKLRAQAKIS